MSISNSQGVNKENSNGINWSRGINKSRGINRSRGINWSDGINKSRGINRSDGINGSFGILNCYGVDNALFLADRPRAYSLFGKEVSRERFEDAQSALYNKLNGWFPKFNNAYTLYDHNGKEWENVDAEKIEPTLSDWEKPYEAWKDMPQEAIDEVKSWDEFDPVMFKRITGIDVEDSCRHSCKDYRFCPNCGTKLC